MDFWVNFITHTNFLWASLTFRNMDKCPKETEKNSITPDGFWTREKEAKVALNNDGVMLSGEKDTPDKVSLDLFLRMFLEGLHLAGHEEEGQGNPLPKNAIPVTPFPKN